MQTKAKKFSKKLLALFMAVLMAITAFSGTFSAFASSADTKYYDDAVEYNELAWPVLSDEQMATALLDYLDSLLRQEGEGLEKAIGKLISGLGVSVLKWDSSARAIKVSVVIVNANISIHLQSIDQILNETLPSIHDNLNSNLSSYIGDGKNIQLDSTRGMSRRDNTSVEILQALVGILQKNCADVFGKDVIGEFLRGGFDLGMVGSLAKIDIYDLLKGLFNADSGYQNNLVYNVVQSLLFNNTNWFTAAEKAAYKANPSSFVYDDVLIEKLNTKFLREIWAEITYKDATGNNQTESSFDRYKAIKAYMTAHAGTSFKAAATALGYDPELVYTEEGGVRLFQYGTNDDGTAAADARVITLDKSDSLFSFGWQALDLVWKTALKDTLATLRVNYDVDRGHGSNFDNAYYYWAKAEYKDWNVNAENFSLANMYAPERITAWANHKVSETVTNFGTEASPVWVIGSYKAAEAALGLTEIQRYGETVTVINDTTKADADKQSVILAPADAVVTEEEVENEDGTMSTVFKTDARKLYETYAASSADEFLGWVQNNYSFDRELVDGSTGKWSDIDPKTLFTKLRYSPLADYGFNMTTGPINLYFMQTGTKNLNTFFNTYKSNYTSLVGGINDALVAAVKDIFINRAVRSNVYGADNAFPYPNLQTTKAQGIATGAIDAAAISGIVRTFVGNAAAVIQYTADAIDSNILKAFYDNGGTVINESNIEGAMMPLLIACIGRINLNGFKLAECIHPEDFDGCKDVEAVLFVALREYLSYILPNNDYNGLASVAADGTITATLNGTILPMARDAVTYVMQGYVPVSYKSGNTRVAWDVYTMGGVNQNGSLKNNADIFELLNSVVCYYAGEYSYSDSSVPKSVGAMGVGALLGICDTNGRSTIVTSNTLWENIDLVANKLLPVLGTLQGKGYNNFSSYQLIWRDIVESLVNIGTVKSENADQHKGLMGVTTILTELLTIVSATPIQTTAIVYTIYDLVEDFFNALVGNRYGNHQFVSSSSQIIPERGSNASPFDNILQVATLAGTGGTNVGILQKLICTVVEYTGYKGTSGNGKGGTLNYYPDSMFRGIMFALKAVQSFVPGILGTIGDHSLGMATAQYTKTTVGGVATNGSTNVSLTFTNNSAGVNNAYVTSAGVKQLGRYYMRITSATAVGSGNASCTLTGYDTNKLINPGEQVTLTGTSGMTGNASAVIATITYDIIEKLGSETRTVKSGVKANAYQYLSGESGWKESVYNGSQYVDAINNTSFTVSWGNLNRTSVSNNGYTVYASDTFAKDTSGISKYKRMSVLFPEYLVLTTSDPYAVNNYQFKVICDTGKKKSIDGFYCYDDKGGLVNDKTNGSNISVNGSNAIPVFDKETGGVVKYGRYDALISKVNGNDRTFYNDQGSVVGTVTGYEKMTATQQRAAAEQYWDRGTVWGHFEGQTDSGTGALGINEIFANFPDTQGYTVQTRDHIAYTIDELNSYGMLKAYHKNAAGLVEYVYLQPGDSNHKYDTVFNQISLRGPVDGIYINQGKMENVDGSAYTSGLFNYDGSTLLEQGQTTVKLCLYNSGDPGYLVSGSHTCTLIITDDNSAEELGNKYKEVTGMLSQYQDSDFTSATVLANTKQAVINSLAAQAAPLTPTSAAELADKTYLTTSTETVASEYGDLAYVPYTGQSQGTIPTVTDGTKTYTMPLKVYADATFYNGVWYHDKAHTMPIYSPKPLAAGNVTNGKDPAGIDVIKGTGVNADKYYLRNTPVYDMVWNEGSTTVRPYQTYKLVDGQKVQSTNNDGDKLYAKVTYVYRDDTGEKVNSDFVWACKFPATEYKCQFDAATGSTVAYRGKYTAERDSLTYWADQLSKVIDASIAAQVVNDVSLKRQGMNNNNFEVVTYNKMTEVARKAERGYSFTFDYIKNGKTEHAEWEGFSDFMKYVNNDENEIIGLTKNADGSLTPDYNLITLNSSLSSIEVSEYKHLFKTYADAVYERGYNGLQIENEIACATDNAYNAFGDVTKAVWEQDPATKQWIRTTDAEVNAGSVTSVPFGAIKDGKLVNEGPVVYASYLWDAYIEALANALAIAKEANSTYAYKTKALYDLEAHDDYTCQVTDCYSADTALQAAEIKLEGVRHINVAATNEGTISINGQTVDTSKPFGIDDGATVVLAAEANDGYEFDKFQYTDAKHTELTDITPDTDVAYDGTETQVIRLWVKGSNAAVNAVFNATAPTGFNVSGSLVVATSALGATTGATPYGVYTISVYSDADRTELVDTFESTYDPVGLTNTFDFVLAPGTYYAKITSDNSIDREDIVIIITNDDVTVDDAIPVICCDFNGDQLIDINDVKVAQVGQLNPASSPECDLNNDDLVDINDIKIIQICQLQSPNLDPITIQ